MVKERLSQPLSQGHCTLRGSSAEDDVFLIVRETDELKDLFQDGVDSP